MDVYKKTVSSIVMSLVLVSFSMLFATLFLSYCIIRSKSPEWPPMGMDSVGLFFPSLSTLLLIFSGLFYRAFEKCYRRGLRKQVFFLWAFVCGLAFTGSQFALWHSLKEQGLYAGSGIFGSIIYGFTWIHTAHIVIGLCLFVGLLPIIKRGENSLDSILKIQNVGTFWHFLGIVWLIMFVGLFLY